MKKIILLFVVLIIVIGSGYGLAQWSLAKSNSKVVKSDNQKSPVLKEEKSDDLKNPVLTEERVKKEKKEKGYKNQQIYALDNLAITKPEFSSFPNFVDQMEKNFSQDYDHSSWIAASYAYAKYFMERVKDEGMKDDAHKIMEQTKKVIINGKDQRDLNDLFYLYVTLDKKYNPS